MNIEELIRERKKILDTLDSFAKYRENPSYYDKIGFGFNLDERFSAHSGLRIRVDAYMGVYGNSGCSRKLDVDNEIFNTHLLRALNKNFEFIMRETAESIRTEAAKEKENRIDELKKNIELVESLDAK